MVSIETVVSLVVYLLVVGMIFGLLFWLFNYVSGKFPSAAPFVEVGRVILVILAVLVLIGILLNFIGHPLIRWGP